MKKLYVALTAISMLFMLSCSKSDRKEVSPEQHPKVAVRFNVADFIQKVNELPSPMGRSTAGSMNRDSSLNKISHIYYLVSEHYHYTTKTIHQEKNVDANFGTISDSLISGDNFIMIVATSAPLNIYEGMEGHQLDLNTLTSNQPPLENQLSLLPDIFYKSFVLSMDDTGSPIPKNIDVTLNRVVSKLSVQFTGTMYEQDDISIKVRREATGFNLVSGNPVTENMNIAYAKLTRENSNLYSGLIMNTDKPLTVEISYVDRRTLQRTTKIIENVTCYKNKVSLLTGALFNNGSDAKKNFEIKLNDLWDYSGPVTPF